MSEALTLTAAGQVAECLCEPDTDAAGCAAAWEEAEPCACSCHIQPGVSELALAEVMPPLVIFEGRREGVVEARAAVGLPTPPPGAANRVRLEEVEGALVAVYPMGGER